MVFHDKSLANRNHRIFRREQTLVCKEGLSTKGEAGKAKLQINGKPAKRKASSPETAQRLGKMGQKKKII